MDYKPEDWFVSYSLHGDLFSNIVEVQWDESPNKDWYRFVDAVKRELIDTTYTVTTENTNYIIILNFIQVNKEDK